MPALHAEHALEDVVAEYVPPPHGTHVFVAASRPLPGGHRIAPNDEDGEKVPVADGVLDGDAVLDGSDAAVGDLEADAICVAVTVGDTVRDSEAVREEDGDAPELDDFEGVEAAVPDTDGVRDFEGVTVPDVVPRAPDDDGVATAVVVVDRVAVRDTDAVFDRVGVPESDDPADGVREHDPGADEPSEVQPHGQSVGTSEASGQK